METRWMKSNEHTDTVAAACRAIESAEEPPKLSALAEQARMSRFHFHRVFKEVTGLTPKAYAAGHRAEQTRRALVRSVSVTQAIYEGGFNSNGRFYEKSTQMLGMTPKNFRNGGVGETIRFAIGRCRLGSILVAASSRGVCAITLGDDPDKLVKDLQDRFRKADLAAGDKDFERVVARVVRLAEKPEVGLDLPLDIRGTTFQRRVWAALCRIPVGTTASYAEIAERIGAPKSVRAVAGAVAANSLAIAIPCHRVIHTDGTISGYRWGVERKRSLLQLESKTKAKVR